MTPQQLAQEYLNSLKRSEHFPVRESIQTAFIKGYEANKWISVDVKPDEEFFDILLYFSGEDCSCSGYYVKKENVFMAHNVMYRGLTVTHWQPLPPKP